MPPHPEPLGPLTLGFGDAGCPLVCNPSPQNAPLIMVVPQMSPPHPHGTQGLVFSGVW